MHDHETQPASPSGPVTPEQVHLAFALMLGREPESEQVVQQLVAASTSVAALRQAFEDSAEFKRRHAALAPTASAAAPAQAPTVRRHPFHLPRIPVESEVTDAQRTAMFARIQEQWTILGNTEPHWSVITQPEYQQTQFAQNKEKFFVSGNHTHQVLMASLRRVGFALQPGQTCIDFGCGVGRVLVHMAKDFASVVGVDISAPHLALAQQAASEASATNISLVQLADITQVHSLPQADVVHSVITLQHNPPPVIAYLFQGLLGRLKPGGVAYVQIPTYKAGYLFEAERYLASAPMRGLEMHYLPQAQVFGLIERAGCRLLEIREDGMIGEEDKQLSNSFVIEKPGPR